MKALALFSGGLDSMLAIKLITSQNIHVTALHMDIGFGGTKMDVQKLQKRANLAGADFEVVDVKNPYLQKVLFNPVHGYGKHFNPCIDCHGFMFKTALSMLKDKNASFIITGEVLGQRPMSQRSEALKQVSNIANNDENLILRPLCAKLLPPTTPQIKGWVSEQSLLGLSGRSRVRQLALAKEFGFDDYETPGGGCLLTLEAFATKIKDFIKYDTLQSEDINLLKFGRHLRLSDGAKLVIGRNESDNFELNKIKNEKFGIINIGDIIGPVAFLSKNATENDIQLALKLVLTYAKTNPQSTYKVQFLNKTYELSPYEDKKIASEYFIF